MIATNHSVEDRQRGKAKHAKEKLILTAGIGTLCRLINYAI
jgi:hypothetical protein